ncbi:uncharacterized protein LOC143180821 [Calliopsis andreniformis]|uniref:uncharacterized protein LOC143180821 n=1 Tax=Calliopsis andreniformis TaxID=337506 RepID=UPI003FCCF614
MAPTVCLSELPVARKPVVPCSRRRRRVCNGAIVKQQRLELRTIDLNALSREASLTPPESPLWEPECPNDSCAPTIVSSSSPTISARVPADVEQQWKVFLARRKGLLDIVVRTMALVRRNNILQEKVNALRDEIREFIHSVLNNPENKCLQQRLDTLDTRDTDVSSSTETTVPRPSLPPTPDSTCSSLDSVTTTCDGNEHTTDRSSDDES